MDNGRSPSPTKLAEHAAVYGQAQAYVDSLNEIESVVDSSLDISGHTSGFDSSRSNSDVGEGRDSSPTHVDTPPDTDDEVPAVVNPVPGHSSGAENGLRSESKHIATPHRTDTSLSPHSANAPVAVTPVSPGFASPANGAGAASQQRSGDRPVEHSPAALRASAQRSVGGTPAPGSAQQPIHVTPALLRSGDVPTLATPSGNGESDAGVGWSARSGAISIARSNERNSADARIGSTPHSKGGGFPGANDPIPPTPVPHGSEPERATPRPAIVPFSLDDFQPIPDSAQGNAQLASLSKVVSLDDDHLAAENALLNDRIKKLEAEVQELIAYNEKLQAEIVELRAGRNGLAKKNQEINDSDEVKRSGMDAAFSPARLQSRYITTPPRTPSPPDSSRAQGSFTAADAAFEYTSLPGQSHAIAFGGAASPRRISHVAPLQANFPAEEAPSCWSAKNVLLGAAFVSCLAVIAMAAVKLGVYDNQFIQDMAEYIFSQDANWYMVGFSGVVGATVAGVLGYFSIFQGKQDSVPSSGSPELTTVSRRNSLP